MTSDIRRLSPLMMKNNNRKSQWCRSVSPIHLDAEAPESPTGPSKLLTLKGTQLVKVVSRTELFQSPTKDFVAYYLKCFVPKLTLRDHIKEAKSPATKDPQTKHNDLQKRKLVAKRNLQLNKIQIIQVVKSEKLVNRIIFCDQVAKTPKVLKNDAPARTRDRTQTLRHHKRQLSVNDTVRAQDIKKNNFSQFIEWMLHQNSKYIHPQTTLDQFGTFLDSIQNLFEMEELSDYSKHNTLILCPHIQKNRNGNRASILAVNRRPTIAPVPGVTNRPNYKLTIQCLQKSLEQANEFVEKNSPLVAQMYFQIGRYFFLSKNFQHAKKNYSFARKICEVVFSLTSEEYAITSKALSDIKFTKQLESKQFKIHRGYKYLHEYYFILGLFRMEEGKFSEAAQALEEGLVLEKQFPPNEPIILQNTYYAGLCYSKCANPSKAIPLFEQLEGVIKKGIPPTAKLPAEMNILNINNLLAENLILADQYSKAKLLTLESLRETIKIHGACSTNVSDILKLLCKVLQKATTTTPAMKMLHLADEIRFSVAYVMIYRALQIDDLDSAETLTKTVKMICENYNMSIPIEQIEAGMEQLMKTFSLDFILHDEAALYTFVNIVFPSDKIQVILKEKVLFPPFPPSIFFFDDFPVC